MARPSYPSDHRRWFRVMEDILDNPKLALCPPAACWLYVQLLAVFNRMKIRSDEALVPSRSLNALTGCDRYATDKLLGRLQEAKLILFVRHGPSTSITIPNWPVKQKFAPANSEATPLETTAPKTTPTPTPIKSRAARPTTSIPEGALVLADRLAAKLTGVPGVQLRGTWNQRWAKEIARILGTTDEIAAVIDWLFDPEGNAGRGQFALVVRSGRALREKYDRAVAAMVERAETSDEAKAAAATRRSLEQADATHEKQRQERQAALEQLHRDGEIESPTEEAFAAAQALWKEKGRFPPTTKEGW